MTGGGGGESLGFRVSFLSLYIFLGYDEFNFIAVSGPACTFH